MSKGSTFRPEPDLRWAVIVTATDQCLGCGRAPWVTPDGNQYLHRYRIGAGLYCSRTCQRAPLANLVDLRAGVARELD